MVWAAKEAAFKLVSKEWNEHHFVPRSFGTALKSSGSPDSNMEFDVSYAGIQVVVKEVVNREWVHAIAMFPGAEVHGWRVRKIAECSQHDHAARNESEAVRFLAAEMLSECGQDEIVDFAGRIPVLRLGVGNASELDISLSHHGGYAGVAIGWSSRIRRGHSGAVQGSTAIMPSGEQCSISMA